MQSKLPPNNIIIPNPNNIIISLSTLGTSIYIIYIYICWDIHSFKMPVLVQKIKVDHSCSDLAVFSLDIGWWFFDIDLYSINSLYYDAADTIRVNRPHYEQSHAKRG